jgi:hypothetical protein
MHGSRSTCQSRPRDDCVVRPRAPNVVASLSRRPQRGWRDHAQLAHVRRDLRIVLGEIGHELEMLCDVANTLLHRGGRKSYLLAGIESNAAINHALYGGPKPLNV